MRASFSSMAAAAAILVLLGAGFALSVHSAASHRVARALDTQAATLGAEFAAAAHQLDMAGRKALDAALQDGDFALVQNALAAGENRWFAVQGVARFAEREGGLKLRQAALAAPQNAAPSPEGVAAQRTMAFRAEAASAARHAADRLRARTPEATFIEVRKDPQAAATPRGERVFWLFWRSADQAVGARLALRDEARREAATVAGIGAVDIEIAPRAGIKRPNGAAMARLGDHDALLILAAPPLEAGMTDLTTALESFGPSLACALLLGGLFLGYARRAEARAAEDNKRNAEILSGVAAKQQALERSEERFRHLAESTNVIPWTADLDHQRFTYIGPQIEALSGFPAEAWLASGFWAQHVHPGDRQRVLVDSVSDASGGKYATVDYRIRGANGRILHVRNMLSADLEKTEHGQRNIAHGFLLDVTELRRAAAAMEVARRRAEDANRVKSEFLANMSHELRTPLNAVIGFSEIMKDELFGPLDERYREYSASVHASGKHLLSLINDVLDLSKIEAGRVELSDDPTDPVEMLKDCRSLLHERIGAAGLRERLEVEDGLPALRLDERRMKQVLLNLMSNAIKFTPPGGEIILGAERQIGRGLRIWVRDTGVGMSEEEIPRALAKFGQVDGELTRKHQGTGLGLPIAKSLVEMHGGSFEIRSKPGKGTEVSLRLPEERVIKTATVTADATEALQAQI